MCKRLWNSILFFLMHDFWILVFSQRILFFLTSFYSVCRVIIHTNFSLKYKENQKQVGIFSYSNFMRKIHQIFLMWIPIGTTRIVRRKFQWNLSDKYVHPNSKYRSAIFPLSEKSLFSYDFQFYLLWSFKKMKIKKKFIERFIQYLWLWVDILFILHHKISILRFHWKIFIITDCMNYLR